MIVRKREHYLILFIKKRIRVLGPQKTDEPTKFLTDKMSSFSLLPFYL